MPAKSVKTFKKELGHRAHRSHRSKRGARPLSHRQAEFNRNHRRRHAEIKTEEDIKEIIFFKNYGKPTYTDYNDLED